MSRGPPKSLLNMETGEMGQQEQVLTLWSFSRRSSPSGMPLRLGGMYQKQTLVC